MDLFVHAGAFKVNLKETGRKLQLITLKTKNRFVGELSIPVLTTVNNLKSRKNLMGLVESLMSKNDVVLTHRHYKNEFDLSGFRVLKFSRLNLLVTLVQTVMFYEMLVGINALKRYRCSPQLHMREIFRGLITSQKRLIRFKKI